MLGETNSNKKLPRAERALISISLCRWGNRGRRGAARSQGLHPPSRPTQGRLLQVAPESRSSAGCPRRRHFCSVHLSFKARAKAAPSPWQLRRRPLGSRCASKGICMKTGTPFAERTGSGVHDALQRPRSCAPLPEQRRQPRAGEDLPTARPPHTASGPRTPPPAARGKGRLDQRFCRLITLFTEAWVEAEPRDPDLAARGRRKEPEGGGSGSQVPALSSAARDPTPHLFSVGCMNVTSPISPRKAAPPWGARPAHRRGSVNDASVAPFQRFPSATPLFGIPLSSHWRQDKLSGKSRGSRTRETWIQILPLHLSAV